MVGWLTLTQQILVRVQAGQCCIWKSWGIGTPPVSKTGKPLAMQVRILSLPLAVANWVAGVTVSITDF